MNTLVSFFRESAVRGICRSTLFGLTVILGRTLRNAPGILQALASGFEFLRRRKAPISLPAYCFFEVF